MKYCTFGAVRALAVVAGFSISLGAAAADDLDVTMRMVLDDAELTDSVVREIELPLATPSELQRNKAASGLDTAEDARDSGREFGQSVAEDARSAKGSVDEMREKPERPEMPSDAKDRVQNVRDKTPPGLDR